jgi:predicted MFS family arabinose efflux permease
LTPIFDLALKTGNTSIKENEILSKALMSFIMFGVGQSISGLLMGKLIDITNSKKACLLNILMMAIVFVVSVRNLEVLEFGFISYLTCFVWGMQDGVVNTHCF